MKLELEEKLADDFQFMRVPEYEDGRPEMHNLYHAYGVECGDGWYDLIYDLCFGISQTLEEHGLPQTAIVVEQVKSKFGGLRFYWSGYNMSEKCYNDISKIVSWYENESYRVCELCGNIAIASNDYSEWGLTLCADCRDKLLAGRRREK